MKKRDLVIYSIVCLAALFIIPLVSAQYYGGGFFGNLDLGEGAREIINQIIFFFTPIFSVLLGDYSGGQILFTKVMLLILVFVFVFIALKNVPLFQGNEKIAGLIAIIISVMGVRFINEQLISQILISYGTLAIALTTIIPFLLFAYFVYATDMSSLGRKLAWIFFAIIFLTLWAYSENISVIGNRIYEFTIIAIILMLAFDKTIAAYFRGENVKEWTQTAKNNEILDLKKRYQDLSGPGFAGDRMADAEKRKIISRMRKLGGSLTG